MNEVSNTNPAERALKFLADFKDSSVRAGSSDRRVRHALAAMYGLKISDTSSLMIVLSDAWKLPVQIQEGIILTGVDPKAFQHVIDDLQKALTGMMLDSQARSVAANIPSNLLASLGMISSMLNKDIPEAMLTREKIDELLKSIADLSEEVKVAELDREFTDYILHRADSIAYALSHYETLGPNEVIARVDQMFGGVLRQYQSLTATKKKSGLVSKLLQIGGAIVLSLNMVNGSFELTENLSKFINTGIQIEVESKLKDAPNETSEVKKIA